MISYYTTGGHSNWGSVWVNESVFSVNSLDHWFMNSIIQRIVISLFIRHFLRIKLAFYERHQTCRPYFETTYTSTLDKKTKEKCLLTKMIIKEIKRIQHRFTLTHLHRHVHTEVQSRWTRGTDTWVRGYFIFTVNYPRVKVTHRWRIGESTTLIHDSSFTLRDVETGGLMGICISNSLDLSSLKHDGFTVVEETF